MRGAEVNLPALGATRRRMAPYTLQTQRFLDGTLASRHYGFPGLAALPSGDLYAVCREGMAHNPTTEALGVIVGLLSSDQGLTWSAPITLHEDPALDLRDPTLAALSDGRLALLYFSYDAATSQPIDALVSYSSDSGSSWSEPEALPFPASRWTAVSGPIVEPAPGHLMAFGYTQVPEVRMVSSVDNGATWTTEPSFLTSLGAGTQEPFACVRPDGLVEVHLRGVFTGTGVPAKRHRTVRRADGTWTPAELFAEGVSGRPSWTINPLTGHRLHIDRSGDHYYALTTTEAQVAPPWTWIGVTGGSQYAQPIPYEDGFLAVLAIRASEFSSLYLGRWTRS